MSSNTLLYTAQCIHAIIYPYLVVQTDWSLPAIIIKEGIIYETHSKNYIIHLIRFLNLPVWHDFHSDSGSFRI